jgi:hypothetical protein
VLDVRRCFRLGTFSVAWAVAVAGLGLALGVAAAQAVPIEAGDIILVDGSSPGLIPPAPLPSVIHVNPTTGVQTTISSGDELQNPTGVAVNDLHQIFVVDRDARAIIRVDAATGSQQIVSSEDNLLEPFGIAIDGNRNLIVTDSASGFGGKVVRIHPTTGSQEVVSDGGLLSRSRGVAIDTNGDYLVTTATPRLVRVTPAGSQTDIPLALPFSLPGGLALIGAGTLAISDSEAVVNTDLNALILLDLAGPSQMVLSAGGSFANPLGVAIDPMTGDILVADWDAFGGGGGIIRVDPVMGMQTTLTSGQLLGHSLSNAFDISVVPAPEPSSALLMTSSLVAIAALRCFRMRRTGEPPRAGVRSSRG